MLLEHAMTCNSRSIRRQPRQGKIRMPAGQALLMFHAITPTNKTATKGERHAFGASQQRDMFAGALRGSCRAACEQLLRLLDVKLQCCFLWSACWRDQR